MKANQPKRKLFNDAVDLLTGDAPDSGIQRGRKIFCVYGEKSSLIRTRYV